MLFELNFTEHPDSFVSTENLAHAVYGSGDRERGLETARRWITVPPDHEGGHPLLSGLRRQGGE